MFKEKSVSFLRTLAVIVFWILIWWGASSIVNREVMLPSPIRVITRLFELSLTSVFWLSMALSLARVIAGFMLGLLFGVVLASASYKVPVLRYLFSPLLTAIKATPVASFIILALVWLGKNSVPVFTAFLMVIPVIWSNVYTGLSNIDKNLTEVTKVFGFSRFKTIKILIIPSVMPYFFSGAVTGIGLAWKASVAAEVLCTPSNSVGKMLYDSKLYLESADLFAWTASVIVFSIILERLFKYLISKLGKKYNTGGSNFAGNSN